MGKFNLKTENQTPQTSSRLFRNKILQVLKFLFLVGLFVALFWIIPFENVWSVLKSVNILLLAGGIFISLVNSYFRTVRLRLLARYQGLQIPTIYLFKVNLIVKFYMLFLPGAFLGSGIRWLKISPEGKSAEALAALGLNRLMDTFFVVVTGLFWFFLGAEQQQINFWVFPAFFLTIGTLWLLFIWFSKLIANWFSERDGENLKPRWQRAWRYFQRIVESINLYTGMTAQYLAVLFGVSVFTNLIGLFAYTLIARSSGITISFLHLGWTQAVISLASMTPLSIAGGLGLREASLVVILPLYGVTTETALAFSLLLLFRNLLLSLLGGLLELIELLQNRARSHKST